MSIKTVQQILIEAGHDPGPVDGVWGSRTEGALRAALNIKAADGEPLAWGAKVSPEFRAKARAIASRLGVPANDLMACMAWESGRTFSPSIRNAAGSAAADVTTTIRRAGTSTNLVSAVFNLSAAVGGL